MENQGLRLKSVEIYNQQCPCNFAAVFRSFRSGTTFIIYNSSLVFSFPAKRQKTFWGIYFLTIDVNSASVTDIFGTIVNNNHSRESGWVRFFIKHIDKNQVELKEIDGETIIILELKPWLFCVESELSWFLFYSITQKSRVLLYQSERMWRIL